jgi:heat-inducible transcriptional repressor
MSLYADLDQRSRDIFREIVEGYLLKGEPVGSRHISERLPIGLSSASIRNVMADLESMGLVYAPHISAGRLPTERGLRFFVDAMLEIGDLSSEEQHHIEAQIKGAAYGKTYDGTLAEASKLLSGLSRGASVVVCSKQDVMLSHIEFVRLDATRSLVVMVGEDGSVENRLLDLPLGLPQSVLVEAGNFLSRHLKGRTLNEVRADLEAKRDEVKSTLDLLTAKVVEAGLAVAIGTGDQRQLIVRGQANLLEDVHAAEDLERIRHLFSDLERQTGVIDLLTRAHSAQGVRIFIGAENELFSLSGSSMIAAPFRDSAQQIVGVIGIIGPTRLNYAHIIPMVDYTAQVVSQLIQERS